MRISIGDVQKSKWGCIGIFGQGEVRAKLCVPHHGGGGICTYAHLHFSAGVPNSPWVEIMRDKPGEFPWPAALVPTVPMMVDKDGNVPLPSGPGIGIDLDEDFIKRYAA